MLKVLYDAANDAADAAQTKEASDALFDDDDDDDASALMTKSVKSGFSLEFAAPNPSTITWADLLRKMKAEMKEIQYAQVPKITSTRKIDLNKPFSLVPDSFDPIKGKKRSLLIGCNYNNVHGAELKASHDDVRSMKVRYWLCRICMLALEWNAPVISLLPSSLSHPIPLHSLTSLLTGLHCQRTRLSRDQGFDDGANGRR